MHSTLPLSGIRVVDLTRVLSGPFCSMLLGDLGADIIKVETPGEGDTVRQQGAGRDGLSWYFANYNRNKRSITLNLRSDEGPRRPGAADREKRRAHRQLSPGRARRDGLH
jgi:crotonobetainyl-CoA:carnitine CoA-transferase CaiB-like acyl-CoA transferase